MRRRTSPHLPAPRMLSVERVGFIAATALLVALAIVQVYGRIISWDLADLNVYWRAGVAWRETGNPFAVADGTAPVALFRYAPWFAAPFVLLSLLPYALVAVAWSALLLAVTVAVTASIVREHGRAGIPFAALVFALLFGSCAGGNVQPLIVGGLYYAMHTRSMPVAVGLAASLKLTPILLVIPWLMSGEWRKVAGSVAVAVLLLAPTFLFSLPPRIAEPGIGSPLDYHPLLYVGLAGASVVAAFGWARTPYRWMAAAAAVVVTIPRMLPLDLSFLAPASRTEPTRRAG